MGRVHEPVSLDGGYPWVDDAVADTAVITDAELAQMDLTGGLDEVLAQVLESEAPRTIRPLRRRRMPRKVATLALAGVIVASAGAAAAVRGGALTGLFGRPGSTEMDRSEYVNIAAANLPAVTRELADQLHREGLRFAPGVNPSHVTDEFVKGLQQLVRNEEKGNSPAARETRKYGILMDVTGIKGRLAGWAQCTWEQRWEQAYNADDAAAKRAAIRGVMALDGVITTTQSKHGTFTGSIMAETNQKKALGGYVRHMENGNYAFILNVTTLNCPKSGGA